VPRADHARGDQCAADPALRGRGASRRDDGRPRARGGRLRYRARRGPRYRDAARLPRRPALSARARAGGDRPRRVSPPARGDGLERSGVRALAALFLGIRIPKGTKTSNWAARRLSSAQIAYAATDAWACRELYLRFEAMRLLPTGADAAAG